MKQAFHYLFCHRRLTGVLTNHPTNPLFRFQYQGQASEQLKHVEVWTFNQNTCRNRLAQLGYGLTDNMLCSGWLDVGGRGQCNGDSGSPLIHYNQQGQAVVVGVTSWGIDCATAAYGSVSARVSRVSVWIQQNAA